MKKASYSLLIVVLLLAACSGSKKIVKTDAKPTAQTVVITDGSTMEKAIVIKATKDLAGVTEEYAWIRTNYPGAKTNGQSLVNKDKKAYDILKITTADGIQKSIYFDITNSFGKY